TITLSSSDTAALPVGALTLEKNTGLAGGFNAGTFTATAGAVTAEKTVTLTATLNGVSKTASVTVAPLQIASLTLAPTTMRGVGAVIATITLTDPAPASGFVVNLASSDPAALKVPAAVTVSSRATSATATLATSKVSASKEVTVTATGGGRSLTARVTVLP